MLTNDDHEADESLAMPFMSRTLKIIGGAIVAFALTADWTVGGSSGIGLLQLLLAGVGALLFTTGMHPTAEDRRKLLSGLAVAEGEAVLGLRGILSFAVVFSFGTALAESAVLAMLRFGFGQMVRTGPHIVWMSSLMNFLVLGLLGMAIWAGGMKFRKLRTPAVVAFVMALLAVDAVIHRLPIAARADSWAKWLLSAGLAVAVARAMRRRYSAEWPPRFGRAALVLSGIVMLLSAAAFAYPVMRERIVRAGLPPAADGPNVLLIILDTVRASSLSLFGYARPTTPHLERFAENGVVFDRAIAPSSWTLPSHAVLFTGRSPNELNADWWMPLNGEYPTLAEVLSKRGYTTAAFSANLAYANIESGLARGFHRFEEYTPTPGEALRTSTMLRRALRRVGAGSVVDDEDNGRKIASDVNRAFLEWLNDKPVERPYFAFLNYFDSHDPYYSEPPFDELFGPVRPTKLDWGKVPDTAQISAWTDRYDRSLAYLDNALGRLFQELDRRGTLDETIVVVTSDHGEHLGEHDFMRHGTTLYLPVLHVPLIVRYPPAVPEGLRVGSPVSLRDVAATVLELAGADTIALAGVSLASNWDGTTERDPAPVYSEVREALRIPLRYPNAKADLYSMFGAEYHYIQGTDGSEELYRHRDDPGESRDLTEDAATEHVLLTLRAHLKNHLGAAQTITSAGDTLR